MVNCCYCTNAIYNLTSICYSLLIYDDIRKCIDIHSYTQLHIYRHELKHGEKTYVSEKKPLKTQTTPPILYNYQVICIHISKCYTPMTYNRRRMGFRFRLHSYKGIFNTIMVISLPNTDYKHHHRHHLGQ